MLKTEPIREGDVVLWEQEHEFGRETKTLIKGLVYKVGMVVGKITSGGKFTEYNNGLSDGTEAAAGVLVALPNGSAEADTTTGPNGSDADVTGVVLTKGPAVIKRQDLIYEGTMDAADKTAAEADLLLLDIKVVDAV